MTDLPLGFERPDLLGLLVLVVPLVGVAIVTRRRLSRGRLGAILAVRLALLVSLVLALAGLTWLQAVDALGVVFVVDRSASVGSSGQEAAQRFVQAALEHQGPEDRVGVVAFGADGLVESEPVASLAFHGVEARPSPHQTDIASGLRLATALLPADRTRRLILLTDGEQTRGDAATQALLGGATDLTLSVVALEGEDGPDILVEDLLAPARVDEGATFDLRIALRSDVPATGSLRLYRNDAYLGALPVSLDTPGRSKVVTVPQEARTTGLYRYRAVFEAAEPALDARPQNNAVMATVQVVGRPRVLIADLQPASVDPLVRVLRGEGLEVDVADGLPPDLPGLRPYAAVFLSDLPAFSLTGRQQRALQTYVRDLGRGLVMLGGPNSFGVGGYYDTPVEAVLPVGVDIEDKTRFPKLAMVHALDKSGSMGGGADSKMDLAKEAVLQTVDLLSEHDLLGVIGFDGAASFIVPLQPLHDKQRVIDDVASIRAGGGTDIYPALARSITALRQSDAALKHVVLVSDGQTTPGAYEPLIREAHRDDLVTVTTIGIGTDSDRATLEDFARWGGGNFYLVTDPAAIPAIFTRETLLATREFLKEEDVRVKYAGPSELIRGLDVDALPTLHGYVVASPKPRATVPLVLPADEHDDPLLAHWRYGLGRSVAWTSDAKGRWATDWLGTPANTRLWGQIARWTVGRTGDDTLQLQAEMSEGTLQITVDAFDDNGRFANFLDGKARVVAPDLTVHELPLEQIAPGRYAASLPVDQDGSWLVGAGLERDGVRIGQAVEEVVQPYSPEYRSRGADGEALLAELARIGGGGMLTDPAAVFARPAVHRRVPHPLWPVLIGLAGFLLLLDVALRRLTFGTGGAVPVTRPAAALPRRAFAATRRPPEAAPAEPIEDAEPDGPAPPEVDPTSYAGRLLAARRSAREKLGDDGASR